jgi:hypothetical protein
MSGPLVMSKVNILFQLPEDARRARETVEIRNTEDQHRFYKIMTSAKGRYVIRPSHGTIQPKSAIQIEILLSLSELDSGLTSLKDKFVIYSIVANEAIREKRDLDEYIKANKDKVHQIIFIVSVSRPGPRGSLLKNDSSSSGDQKGSVRADTFANESIDSKVFQTVRSRNSVANSLPQTSLLDGSPFHNSNFKKSQMGFPQNVSHITSPQHNPVVDSVYVSKVQVDLPHEESKELIVTRREIDLDTISRMKQQNMMLESELKMIRVW